ncbi:MAG: prolyl oligopeptidase family serine peptidase, partial [Acidobacteriota bacterium]
MPRQMFPVLLFAFVFSSRATVNPSSGPAGEDLETLVGRMARVGSSWSPSFSPDGKRLAFVSNLTGVPQVWTVPTEGGFPELVTALDDPVGNVSWSPDGAWLSFTLAPGGGMNTQVYLVRQDGTELRRLTEGGKDTNRMGVWFHDGSKLTLGSNRRSGEVIDAYVADVTSGELRLVTENRGVGGFTSVSRDGRAAVLFRLVSRGDSNLFLVDLSSGQETLLTPHEPPGSFNGELSPDGRAVYLSSNKDRDLAAFARIRLGEGGRPGGIEVLAERRDGELQSFALTEDGALAALNWNVAGRNELAFVDLVTGKQRPGPKTPGEVVRGLEFSPGGRFLAMEVSGAALPRDIWVYDLREDRLRQVTRSPHAGVDVSTLVRPELVRFKAHDGLELSGWLYRPRGTSGAGPVVLSFHGGPEGQERPRFRADYQALLSQGIYVFAPNVRGSSGFGKRFVNLDNGALRANGIRDIKASVDYVVEAGVADPKRLGIMGGSYGGYMTMAGLTEYPELFAAGANLYGVVNFETFFEHTEPWMAAISTVEYGDPETEAEMLHRLSPIHKIDRVIAPTIVLHGANDTNVPVVEATQVVEFLKERGVPVEYILFPDEGHGFRKEPNR